MSTLQLLLAKITLLQIPMFYFLRHCLCYCIMILIPIFSKLFIGFKSNEYVSLYELCNHKGLTLHNPCYFSIPHTLYQNYILLSSIRDKIDHVIIKVNMKYSLYFLPFEHAYLNMRGKVNNYFRGCLNTRYHWIYLPAIFV